MCIEGTPLPVEGEVDSLLAKIDELEHEVGRQLETIRAYKALIDSLPPPPCERTIVEPPNESD